MKQEDMQAHEVREVKKLLKEYGYTFDLYVIEAVLNCYAEFLENELPEVNEEDMSAFILDNLSFDPELKQPVSKETLERIDHWKWEYMKQIGLIPEDIDDLEEDDE